MRPAADWYQGPFSITLPFSFRPLRFGFLAASEVRFPLSGFFNLDDLRVVTHDFQCRNGTYSLRVALIRLCFLPWHRNGTYSLHVALTRLCFLLWRSNGTYSLRVAFTRLCFLPWRRNRTYSLRVALTRPIYLFYLYILYMYISFPAVLWSIPSAASGFLIHIRVVFFPVPNYK
jgi:hypothetical protein